jgi:hypothetical protein
MKKFLVVLLFCSVTTSYASDLSERSRAAQVLVSEEAAQKLSRAELVKLMASVEKVALLLPSPGNTGAYLALERELARLTKSLKGTRHKQRIEGPTRWCNGPVA